MDPPSCKSKNKIKVRHFDDLLDKGSLEWNLNHRHFSLLLLHKQDGFLGCVVILILLMLKESPIKMDIV